MLKEKRQLYTTLLFLGGSDKLPPKTHLGLHILSLFTVS